MSTRAHIIIKKKGEEDTYVYHHCDGYPDGVGEDLKRFIIDEGTAEKPKSFATLLNERDDYFRIDDGIHGDEEYIYYIDIYPDKVIISVETGEYIETADSDWEEIWKEIPEFTETIKTNVGSKR